MKRLISILFCFLAGTALFSLHLFAGTVNWNRNWEFQLGDVGADAKTGWQPCFLPHSFSAPYFLGTQFYLGEGWYRKKITPADYADAENVFLDFEGVFQFADVFVDGVRVGGHRSGYTGFRVDLTPALKRSRKEQTIAVRVSNRWDSRTAPRAGEHIFTGGINRDVKLVTAGTVFIARNGVTVKTPKVSEKSATLEVSVEVCNSSAEPRDACGKILLRFPDSKTYNVVKDFRVDNVPAHGSKRAEFNFKISRPHLWSPDSPALYPLTVEIAEEPRSRDARPIVSKYACNVGFRFFEFTADKGFFLNGKRLFLLGANVHQDCAGWGDGVTNASHARDVKMMKDAGFNFIRGSHYPHDPAFLDACDRYGILFWSEGGIWGMGGQRVGTERWNDPAIPHLPEDREPFAQSAETLVREMVRDAKNHPCVIAWSVCNEPFFVPGDLIAPAKAMTARLLKAVKEEDPTRPAAVGGVQRAGFDKIEEAELVGYNGDGARIFQNPAKPNIVAEYGSTISRRPGDFAPGWGEFGNERPEWRSGAAIWCGFDHGSIWEAGSRMGIVDYFRLPKRAWFWYRENLTGTPEPERPQPGVPAKLQLSSDKTELVSCAGEDDALITVKILDKNGRHISNSVPVTLRVVDGPGEFPTGKTITFRPNSDIDIRDGIAAIAFRSNFNGKATIVAEAKGLKSAKISIFTNDKNTPDADKNFVRGKSVETPDRAYRGRFVPAKNDGAAVPKTEANLAENRPCRATSSDATARLAADGNEATVWRADKNDRNPAWTLDLEFLFKLKSATLVFPKNETARDCFFEISADGKRWKKLVPESSENSGYRRIFRFGGNVPATKFFRIRFEPATVPAALCEVIVRGNG